MVITMGGGYNKDIQKTVEASADVYRQAACVVKAALSVAWEGALEPGAPIENDS